MKINVCEWQCSLSHTERGTNGGVFALSKLLAAYISCRRTKRKTINALKFELNLEANLLDLQKQLESRTYRPKRSICFMVTYPKVREIFAADFSDRIIHHLLVSEIESYFERTFIHNSFACRKGKGIHEAVKNLYRSLNKVTKNQTRNAFYGQFDIQSFFTTIDKQVLYEAIEAKIIKLKRQRKWKDEILYLLKTIIFHNPVDNYVVKGRRELFKELPPQKSLFYVHQNKGLPIGNLTSQFFANVYLDCLDQFIKRELKVKYYFRYVDDLILVSHNQNEIKKWRCLIGHFLEEKLKIKLHPQKDKYGSVYQGIDFVGYVIKPDYILSRKRVVNNLKVKLHFFNQGLLLISGSQRQKALPLSRPPTKEEIGHMTAAINSYFGHFCQANCYNLRKNLYEKHFGELKNYLKPEKDLRFFSPFEPAS